MKKCGNSQKSGISAEPTSLLEAVGKVDIVTRDIDDDFIKSRIFTVRDVQVILDRDLATLYGVEVKYLNRQVKRNIERFPADFMFQLSKEECLRCQIVTLNEARGQHLKYMPYVFMENGIAMLSVKAVGAFHDRFLILDDRELYHFGASLKDLGRQYCAVTKMDAVFIPSVLQRI